MESMVLLKPILCPQGSVHPELEYQLILYSSLVYQSCFNSKQIEAKCIYYSTLKSLSLMSYCVLSLFSFAVLTFMKYLKPT